MEQNTFCLPDRHKTHLSSAAFDFSASESQFFLSIQTMFFIGCPFLMKKLVYLYAFYGLQNAAYNNVFTINVQDFCGSMTVCFVFFCTANVDKKGGWKQKAVRCCCTVVVMPSSFYIIHPVASVLEMRCKEYLRLFYILVVFMYVYICVYIHTHLHLIMPFHFH